MKFNILLLSVIATLLFVTESFSQQRSQEVVGNWESVKVKSNYVDFIQFKSDGSYVLVTAATSDYTFKLKGDTLITKLERHGLKKPVFDTSFVEIRKDTLINYYYSDGKKAQNIMLKEPGSNSNGIYGDYFWRYPNGHLAFSKFTKDGHLLFRLPRLWVDGKFKVINNTIVFSPQYLKEYKSKFWIKGNILVITDEKTKEEKMYRKIDYFVK